MVIGIHHAHLWNSELVPYSEPSETMQSHKISSDTYQSHHNSGLVQFPQPTRPIGSYDLSSAPFIAPQHQDMIGDECHAPQDMVAPQCFDQVQFPSAPKSAPPTTTTELEEEKGRAVNELYRSILEIYDKLPGSIRNHLTLDERSVLASMQDPATRRGRQGSLEELKHKLERFKVRTIELAAIVKEEERKG